MVVLNVNGPVQGALLPGIETRKIVTFTVPRPPPPTGEELKEDAIKHMDKTCAEWLARARTTARTICCRNGRVTSDDVIAELVDDPPPHFNATGAIFKNGDFYQTGFRKSTRPEAHSRIIGIWTLKSYG